MKSIPSLFFFFGEVSLPIFLLSVPLTLFVKFDFFFLYVCHSSTPVPLTYFETGSSSSLFRSHRFSIKQFIENCFSYCVLIIFPIFVLLHYFHYLENHTRSVVVRLVMT